MTIMKTLTTMKGRSIYTQVVFLSIVACLVFFRIDFIVDDLQADDKGSVINKVAKGPGTLSTNRTEHHYQYQNPSPFPLSLPVNETIQEKEKRILPISFGLPTGRFARAQRFQTLNKTRDFAWIVPGAKNTYIYPTEESYYDGYATALFGITMKKAGWDCFRHYEIIASGSMPYFLDIEHLPSHTMHTFPVHIVQKAMQLPGVPSQDQVKRIVQSKGANSTDELQIDHSIFNRTAYNELMEQLIQYSLQHLTWRAIAQNVLDTVHEKYPCYNNHNSNNNDDNNNNDNNPPRVLFVTTQYCDYMSCVLFGGMYEALGGGGATTSTTTITATTPMASFFGPKVELFQSLSQASRNKIYGGGFSYKNEYETWNGINGGYFDNNPVLRERFDQGYFNTIILTNADNMFCGLEKYFWHHLDKKHLLYEYQKKYNPLVIVLDGSDGGGCHPFPITENNTLHYHFHFIREYNAARRRDRRLPHGWSGCDRQSFHQDS